MERRLIAEYETLVERVMAGLEEANHAQAAALLAMAEEVRGYGPVKKAAAEAYQERVAIAYREYRSPPAGGDGRPMGTPHGTDLMTAR